MARTQGHGNPSWSREETILALELYFALQGQVPSEDDGRVRELSALLRRLPFHAPAAKRDSFRNSAGVVFKLQNLRQVATGRGLANVSALDRSIWEELGANPGRTRQLASGIRAAIHWAEKAPPDFDLESEFPEGRLMTILHSWRERDRGLRHKLLMTRIRSGPLACEMCGTVSFSSRPELEDAMFEVHHLVPLACSGQRITRLSEVALLCANCHRLIHRAIAATKRWLTLSEAREYCGVTYG